LPVRSWRSQRILSGEWRIWSAKNQPDLYVAIRSLGQFKAAVHCPRAEKLTWRRHYGFDHDAKGDVIKADHALGLSRHKGTWDGAKLGNHCTLEYKIFIPASALSKKTVPSRSDTLLIPPPQGAQSLIGSVILGPAMPTDGYPKMQDEETYLLAEGRLCDGRRVWVVYAYATVKFPTSPKQMSMNIPPGHSVEEIPTLTAQGNLRALRAVPALQLRPNTTPLRVFDNKANRNHMLSGPIP
jgi:hypothetical protein